MPVVMPRAQGHMWVCACVNSHVHRCERHAPLCSHNDTLPPFQAHGMTPGHVLPTGPAGPRALPVTDTKPSPPGPVAPGAARSPYCSLSPFRGRRKGRSEPVVTLGVERFGGPTDLRLNFDCDTSWLCPCGQVASPLWAGISCLDNGDGVTYLGGEIGEVTHAQRAAQSRPSINISFLPSVTRPETCAGGGWGRETSHSVGARGPSRPRGTLGGFPGLKSVSLTS